MHRSKLIANFASVILNTIFLPYRKLVPIEKGMRTLGSVRILFLVPLLLLVYFYFILFTSPLYNLTCRSAPKVMGHARWAKVFSSPVAELLMTKVL